MFVCVCVCFEEYVPCFDLIPRVVPLDWFGA